MEVSNVLGVVACIVAALVVLAYLVSVIWAYRQYRKRDCLNPEVTFPDRLVAALDPIKTARLYLFIKD